MLQTIDPTNPLQRVREGDFHLSRPQMAALLGVPYGELYGVETGARSVTRRIVQALNALGHDGEAVKIATRAWMDARAARLAAELTTATPARG